MGFVQLGAQALPRQFDHQAESIRWPRPAEPREPNFGRGTFQGQSSAKWPKIGLRPASRTNQGGSARIFPGID
jgi:hypothetical protein